MIRVDLESAWGSDLVAVNAARVSFGKSVSTLSSRDEKLISYLNRNDHWAPFAHAALRFRISAPVFVARQLAKHQVGLIWSEVSRRYVSSEVDCFMPSTWRANPEDKKQGSSGTDTVTYLTRNRRVGFAVRRVYEEACNLYSEMLEAGVCAEQARMVLPLGMMTEWIWTGSLYAFARVCRLRCASDTQKETREVADQRGAGAGRYIRGILRLENFSSSTR